LHRRATATQLIVDGRPFLALAGELGNNTATSLDYMQAVWPKLVKSRLNSVLAAVSWAQIEPEEGKFDFSVLDGVIRDARIHDMRLVLLWFASWKNGLSTYAPDWAKRDFERFPRIQLVGGRSIELLSPFSDANRDADARAFAAVMRHVRAVDGERHTIVMAQLENEIGVPDGMRDRSIAAKQVYAGRVPPALMAFLARNKDPLIPELRQVWEVHGFKTSGGWEDVFGEGSATEEIFMSWYFARYVERVADAGKAEYPIPMYVNAWAPGFAKGNQRTNGQVASPIPDVIDVWHATAPHIDLLAPDIYDYDYPMMCAAYNRCR
jgi:beta-galactosidase GanA